MNLQPDANGQLVFSQRVYDDNGDDITIVSVQNTLIDGADVATTYGTAWLEPEWLQYTIGPKKIDSANGHRSYRDLNFAIPFDQLDSKTYTIDVEFSDGTTTVNASFDLALDKAPAAVQNVAATVSLNQVDLTWDANTEADLAGYNVYRSTTPGGPYTQVNGTLIAAGTQAYSDTTVASGTTYYYRLKAQDTAGQEGQFSDEVSVLTAKVVTKVFVLKAFDGWLVSANPDGTNVVTIATFTAGLRKVAVDDSNQKVYVALGDGRIVRMNFDGTAQEDWKTGINPHALFIHGGRVYWSNDDTTDEIKSDVFAGGSITTHLAGDTMRGLWVTDTHIWYTENANGVVKRAAHDGTNVETMATLTQAFGLAVDEAGGYFYYSDNASTDPPDVYRRPIDLSLAGAGWYTSPYGGAEVQMALSPEEGELYVAMHQATASDPVDRVRISDATSINAIASAKQVNGVALSFAA